MHPASHPALPLAFPIWLADDDAGYGDALAESLVALAGAVGVRTFASGEALLEALAALAPEAHPWLVLLDVRMPGEGGVASARRLHALHPHLPVLMLTSADDPETTAASLAAGASGVVRKETPFEQLGRTIEEVRRGNLVVPPEAVGLVRALLERAGPSR